MKWVRFEIDALDSNRGLGNSSDQCIDITEQFNYAWMSIRGT